MFRRLIFGATKSLTNLAKGPKVLSTKSSTLGTFLTQQPLLIKQPIRNWSCLTQAPVTPIIPFNNSSTRIVPASLLPCTSPTVISTRPIIKFSLRSGKRKTSKTVLLRFYRLNWGIWIRGKCGRQKKIYKKSHNRRRRLRQHVFTNAKQSMLLDRLVTRFWRKPKYFVDDPYEPYHTREEFPLSRKKPYIPVK